MSQAASNLQLAPLRSLNDFVLDSARFQLPNFGDFEKWGKRVVNNLLYYQTNYFLLGAVLFTLVGLLHPGKIGLGVCLIGGALFGLYQVYGPCKKTYTAQQIAGTNKYAVIGLVLSIGYIALYLFDAVLIVAFAVLLPITSAFIHSSLRLRNLKNKITNTVEIVGIKQSPMGKFLEAMGLMPDTF